MLVFSVDRTGTATTGSRPTVRGVSVDRCLALAWRWRATPVPTQLFISIVAVVKHETIFSIPDVRVCVFFLVLVVCVSFEGARPKIFVLNFPKLAISRILYDRKSNISDGLFVHVLSLDRRSVDLFPSTS